ncbi:quinolinate synthase NadA [bacterium]|nr:quinolinate synthase NadA [bacterium]
MTETAVLTAEIRRLRDARRAVLLAHNYQRPEVQDAADFTGDSLELARRAATTDAEVIVFCGVTFMAETAKILSPERTVLLPRMDASCPMAEMTDLAGLRKLKAEHPGAVVAAYVNSTAEVKAESDVCVTSANAVRIVQRLEGDTVIFLPDRNLASWVARFTDKKIIPWPGFCYVHEQFTAADAVEAKRLHPDAVLMVHPECRADVADLADEVLSTSGMLKFAAESGSRRFIVGTEQGILHRLKKENPGKEFLSLGPVRTCLTMKKTRLEDVRDSLKHMRHEITLPVPLMNRARTALERMLSYA